MITQSHRNANELCVCDEEKRLEKSTREKKIHTEKMCKMTGKSEGRRKTGERKQKKSVIQEIYIKSQPHK